MNANITLRRDRIHYALAQIRMADDDLQGAIQRVCLLADRLGVHWVLHPPNVFMTGVDPAKWRDLTESMRRDFPDCFKLLFGSADTHRNRVGIIKVIPYLNEARHHVDQMLWGTVEVFTPPKNVEQSELT